MIIAAGGAVTPSCERIKSMRVAVNHLFGPNGSPDLIHDLVRFGELSDTV